ncbi:MAG: serine/threonine protein kinase [Candidatus Saccharimonas sp.]|nr:serine/threonine protein kinase [Planctomycetaceae bacterium]
MTQRMIGPFEVGDRIGVGGMGIVYRATYTKNGAQVALKILSPELSETESLQRRFEREVSILKKLQHPHIVRYYGGGKFGTQRFYAMELVLGGSVEDLLKEKKKLPWEEALDIAMQVAKALEHAHEAGIIHRDLKPANLMLTRDRIIKLTDFGIARDTTATALTAAGKTVGTYAYMAPEQIRGKPPVDKKTDLYALGCVLFEMIAGETPFQSENQGEMLMMHLQEEPTRITSLVPDCPIFVEELIFHLLEKDPRERPFDALDVQTKIDNVRRKITEQQSMIQQATVMMSNASPEGIKAAEELKASLAKTRKKKKKKDNSQFYERTWFLSLCLSLVVVGIGWTLWNAWWPSEDALMARAEQLMKSEFTLDHVRARDGQLKPLLERFPNGKHTDQAQTLIVDVDKEETLNKMRARVKLRQPPLNEAELQYLNAEQFLKFGDRVTALRKYRSIVELFQTKDEFRIYVLLAQDEVDKIMAQGGDLTLASFLNTRLKNAETSKSSGKLSEAEAIWTSIKTLYEDNEEASAHVAFARKRLADPKADPGPPPWNETEPSNPESK